MTETMITRQDDRIVLVKEVARHLGREDQTILRRQKDGKLPPFDRDQGRGDRGWWRSNLLRIGIDVPASPHSPATTADAA